ncbi:hypothetical protein CDD81_2452 [Ophiocordyceps australis]|uniref:Indoleamine 2,3-dioxygenase n=1 Tax=Ophiocordyceps australis TaxID=1399860 RepID=A0A2C5XRF3_9HYPO|nr:hypothetical protein CDD81_2452 [Ophiocordyceps australis]
MPAVTDPAADVLPIPVLEDYGLSPTLGFLPETLPLTHLPDPYYYKWEAIAANLQAQILTRRLRGVVDALPVLSTVGLEHEAEWRRAYSLLCFIAHAYIWGGDSPAERLPPSISVPLLEISERLEVPPVATYAGLCLWNFKPLFLDEFLDSPENLATLNTFTGSIDESWFYIISVAIECRGAPILPLVLTAMGAARAGDTETVIGCLRAFAERLTDLTIILQRMHESCDPIIFYHRIRPFLAGSKNMAEAGLPKGVFYDTGNPDIKPTKSGSYRQYSGGSNAQSSLIQFFDIALGIRHRPTGQTRDSTSSPTTESHDSSDRKHNFIQEMRKYMPGPHARFLEDVTRVANIREFVQSHRDNHELCLAYDACLAMLSAFRDKHIAIVARYIITPSREARARSRSRTPEPTSRKLLNLATASSKNASQHTGTGGTALMPFLKQARDETAEPAVEEWTKRFMKRKIGVSAPPQQEQEAEAEKEKVDVKGLAWTWTMNDDVGGICLV